MPCTPASQCMAHCTNHASSDSYTPQSLYPWCPPCDTVASYPASLHPCILATLDLHTPGSLGLCAPVNRHEDHDEDVQARGDEGHDVRSDAGPEAEPTHVQPQRHRNCGEIGRFSDVEFVVRGRFRLARVASQEHTFSAMGTLSCGENGLLKERTQRKDLTPSV